MTLFILMLFSTEAGRIQLDPVSQYTFHHRRVSLGPGGVYCAGTHNFLYVWDRDGSLIHRIGGDEINRLSAYYFDGEYFLVCDVVEDGGVLHVYDTDGVHLFQTDLFFHFFRKVDDQLFVFPLFLKDGVWLYQFPLQAHSFTYQVSGNELQYELGKLAFARMTQRQQDFIYNYKQNWIVKVNDVYNVVNQIDDRVYHYDADSISKDYAIGADAPTAAPFTTLTLPQFRLLDERFSPPKGIYDNASLRKMRSQWWHSYSRITGFYPYKNGFAVSYEIPDCPQVDQCDGSLLAIQRLGTDFKPVGEFVETKGMLMGVFRDQLYVFEPNPVEDDNGEPNGMEPAVVIYD